MICPSAVIKRDGQQVPFDLARVTAAIHRAQLAVEIDDPSQAEELAMVTVETLCESQGDGPAELEQIQDTVVLVLQESGNYDVALQYSRYRDARERQRRVLRSGDDPRSPLNIKVRRADGRLRAWDRNILEHAICRDHGVSEKVARDVACWVEEALVDCATDQLSSSLVHSLVEAGLLRCGLVPQAESNRPGALTARPCV